MKLTARKRDAIPTEKFLGPDRTFPGNDVSHLRFAIPAATRSENAGNISHSTAEHIKAAARKRLRLYRGKK
jgi:hypothetical protein